MSGCCGPVKPGCCGPTPSAKPADSGCCGPTTSSEGSSKVSTPLPKAALQKAWSRRANGGAPGNAGDPLALQLEKQRSEQERAQAASQRDAKRSARKA